MTPSQAADKKFSDYFSNPTKRMVMNIEYSSLGDFLGKGNLPGNTEMHFRKSIELGFDGLKADMRLTSDGEIVLCHDAGYTFDDNGKITRFNRENFTPIHDLTLDKVLALEFADTFDGEILHPCTLDTMLALCDEYGMVPYLTLRYEPWQPVTAKRMVELILKHNLQHRTIVNLFPGKKEGMDCVAPLLSGLEYSNTRVPDDELTNELIDSSAADGFKIICLCRRHIESVTPEKCQYAASKGIHIWMWASYTLEECAEDLSLGITGFQMYNRLATNSVIAKMLDEMH